MGFARNDYVFCPHNLKKEQFTAQVALELVNAVPLKKTADSIFSCCAFENSVFILSQFLTAGGLASIMGLDVSLALIQVQILLFCVQSACSINVEE